MLKFIVFICLMSFSLPSFVEARQQKTTHQTAVKQKKTVKARVKNKRKALASRKKPQRTSRAKKGTRSAATNKKSVRAARSNPAHAKVARPKHPRIAVRNRKRPSPPVQAPHPQQPLPINPPPTYLSLLNPHTLQKAKNLGLDTLYAKNLLGKGTVAVVEYSGEWGDMKNVIHNNQGHLPPTIRENYRKNFLSPIGGPGLHPEESNDWIRSFNDGTHGSKVASVVLDLAPKAKVLPVSTYKSYHTQFYDTADALMDLAQKEDVGVINISGGHVGRVIN